MFTTLALYLLEVLFCSGLFILMYHLFFSKVTHFRWMRYYLLLSLILPLILPLIPWISFTFWSQSPGMPLDGLGQNVNANLASWLYELPETQADMLEGGEATHRFTPLAMVLSTVHILGVLFYLFVYGQQLYRIWQLMRTNQKEKKAGYWLVWLEGDAAPCSFLNYLFLGKSFQKMEEDDLEKVKQHELVHIRQRHSLDLLMLEFINAFFWFNPFHRLLRKHLQDVHEYLADVQVAGIGWQPYAHLLLQMSKRPLPLSLTAGFSAQQIGRRIRMMRQKRSGKWSLLRFAVIMPSSVILLFLFSCLEEVPEKFEKPDAESELSVQAGTAELIIGSISWEGNQLYTDDQLSEIFGIKSGDPYDSATVSKQLNYHPDRTTISDLYMDQGYLFFSIEVKKQEGADQVVDLRMNIFEGTPNRLGDITVRGNNSMSTEEILREIDMEPGELFSRNKLIGAQRTIAELGYFDPQNVSIHINPIPKHEEHVVDIEFVLEEINK